MDANLTGPTRESIVLRGLAYASPLLIIATLLLIYLASADFYLTYVLEFQYREYQAVEMLTVAFASTASLVLFYVAWRLGSSAWRTRPASLTLHQRFDHWFPTLLVLALALACFVLVGEELSWGQTFKYWGIAESDKPIEYETNVHNNSAIPMQSVGQAFLIGVFFIIPGIWAFRQRLNLPAAWRVIVAEGPVIFAAVVSFAWKGVKELYVEVWGTAEADTFYWGFIEQINEQKELLLALTLLLYALYRIRAVWSAVPAEAGPDA